MVKKRTSSAKQLLTGILGGAGAADAGEAEASIDAASQKTILEHRQERMHPELQKDARKTRAVSTIRVDPARCRIQQRPNRIYELLDEKNCADLIASIENHGQETPAIARETGEKGAPFEIVVGRRRHWVAQHLKRDLLVELRVLTDEQAFLISEAENEGRRDLSDFEKAQDWADALKNFYGGKVDRLAVAINKPRETVYGFLRLAALDDRVVNAYDTVLDIKRAHAEKYAALLKDRTKAKRVFARAAELEEKKIAGNPLDGAGVFKALSSAAAAPKKAGGLLLEEAYSDSGGRPVFKITRSARGGYAVNFDKDRKCDKEELKRLLLEAVDAHIE